MDKTTDKASLAAVNTAQRLRKFLGVPNVKRPRKAPKLVREQMVFEAMEPRVLLSGESLVIPPAPPQQQVLSINLNDQLGLGVVGAGGAPTIDLTAQASVNLGQVARSQANEVVFVDSRVADYQALLDQALAARGLADPARVDVVVLDAETDGVAQIANWLAQYQDQPLRAVHLLTHGADGEIQLGDTLLNNESLGAYAETLARWANGLTDAADVLIYGCDVAAGATGESFVARLSELTGADVAASSDRTGASDLGGDWLLERSTGVIDAVALQSAAWHSVLSLDATTLNLNATLRTQLLSVLEKVDAVGAAALDQSILNADLPGLGLSVNELIGLDSNTAATKTIGLFGSTSLKSIANTYFSAQGNSSTLSGLSSALTTALQAAMPTNNGQSWSVLLTPSFNPAASEVVAGLQIKLDLSNWTRTGQTFQDIASFTESGTLTSVANVHIDVNVGLTVAGVGSSTDAATALTNATSTNLTSWFSVNQFDVEAKVTGGAAFVEQAGLSVTLVDTNNSDRLDRITLADFADLSGSTTADKAASALSITTIASLSGNDGTRVLTGSVVAGVLTASTFADVSLSSTDLTNLRSAFSIGAGVLSKVDALTDFGVTLPMADVSLSSLLSTSDGRSFSDVLSFRTPKNTTVLDDYLASTSTPKASGLIQYLTQYLTGTGVYDGLEAMMSASAVAAFMNVGLTGASGNFALDLKLRFARQFMSRFTFDDKLAGLGIDWLPGEGVKLEADVGFDSIWTASSNASVEVNTLTTQVHTTSSELDAGLVLGVLEARAVGTLTFSTDAITVNVASGNAVTAGGVTGAAVSLGATPTISAAADFDVTGSIGSTSFTALVNRTTTDATSNELVITTHPTVDALTTTDTTPTITGTATLSAGQKLVVSVDGTEYTVVSYDGTTYTTGTNATYDLTKRAWSLTIATPMLKKSYTVTAQLLVPYTSTTNAVAIDVSAGTQTLTGTVASARDLTISLSGPSSKTYTESDAALTYDGTTWTLVIPKSAVSAGSYTQTVTAQTPTGTAGTATLTVVNKLPAKTYDTSLPTVNALTTNFSTPILTGKATLSQGQTLTVKVMSGSSQVGQTYRLGDGYLNYNSDTHEWTLALPTTLAAGTYSVVTSLVMVPHVAMSYGATNTSLDVVDPVSFSDVEATTLAVSVSSDFDVLRKFANLDSASLSNMLTDLGTYLQMLRDSGQFDAVLPYTNLTLGKALDFSAVFNQITDAQMVNVLASGITASDVISPVLTQNVSFDLQFTRPGDARTSLVTVTILASETTSFTHISQLAELIDKKLAAAYGGMLAYTTGDGTVPTSASATINQTVEGGVALGAIGKSDEIQTVVLNASSGTFTLTLDGHTSGPLSVTASTVEVQHALESMLGVGVGNVVVTGTPKHYSIEFIGDLAGQDMSALTVAFQNATAGGALDVLASDLELADGVVKGRLNILEHIAGTFSALKVAPSAGVSLQSIVAGSTKGTGTDAVKTAAVQRITVAYGVGGTFTISGKKADGTTSFKTAAISMDLTGAWSTRIQSAINTALGLDATTGVTVAVVSPSVLTTNQGVQAFDITFGGTSVNGIAFDTFSASVTTTSTDAILSRPGVQAGTFVLREAAPAVGSQLTGTAEIQRLVLSNVTWGTGGFSFGFSSNGQSYESDAIYLYSGSDPATKSAVASDIRSALFNLLHQMDASINNINDITVSVAVNDATSATYAFDIAFGGSLAGRNMAQIIVNPVALTPAGSTSVSYGNLTLAGFSKSGQDTQRTAVTTFTTLNDLMALFQQAVNDNLADGVSFSVDPRFDAATSSFLFDLKFSPDATVSSVDLVVPESVGDMSGLTADATLDLSTSAYFEATVGIDFRQLNTFALQAAGMAEAVITGTLEVTASQVNDISDNAQTATTLSLVMGNEWDSDNQYTVTIPKTDYLNFFLGTTGTPYTYDSLLTAIQGALNGTAAKGDLADRGFSTVGQAVTASWKVTNSKHYLQFTVHASLSSVSIDDTDADTGTNDARDNRLGFAAPMVSAPAPKLTLPTNGQLSADATFALLIDDTTPIAVIVRQSDTTSNTSVADLIADINAAFQSISVAGDAYLGSAGLGFSTLDQIVKVYPSSNGQLQLLTLTPKVGALEVRIPNELNTSFTELGFQNGQKTRTSGAEVFLQNVTLGGDWSATVHDQTAAAGTTLLNPGTVGTGMLDLTFDKLGTDYQGSYRFELRNDLADTTSSNDDKRLSLNSDLFDAVTSQMSQLGMGGAVSTKSDQVVSGTIVQDNGRLLRDVGLTVTLAGLGAGGADLVLDITITAAATADNNSIQDLADDIDAAIANAVKDAGVTAVPYAGATGHTATSTTIAAGASGTNYQAKYGYVGVYTFFDDNNTAEVSSDDSTSLLLQFFAPTSSATTSAVQIDVTERLLVANTMTPIVFAQNTGTDYATKTGPTASLSFSNLSLNVPSSLASQAVVTNGTVVTISVNNLAAVLAGDAATTDLAIVPTDGLGTLTPLAKINWNDLASQFAGLPELFGSLAGLGQYGELGRLLPLLGSSVSDVFGLADRLDAIQAALAALDGSVVAIIGSAGNATQVQDYDLANDATFSLSFDDEAAYDFTLPKGSSSREGLLDDLQQVLDTTDVQSDSALSKLGYRKVGQAVTVQINRTTQQIEFVTRADVQTMKLSAASTSTFVTELGFLPSVTATPESSRVSLASLQSVLSNTFGSNGVSLSYDSTANAEALRFKVPYSVTIDQDVALKILFNDEFSKLLSAADQAKLSELVGTVTAITDGDMNAPLRLSATVTFNFDFGLDLAEKLSDGTTANPAFGKIFLYDHQAAGAAGLADDTGTFATISLTASATGMNFDNNIGVMTLRVQDGSASLALSNTSLVLDKDSDGAVDRTYLNTYDALYDTANATGATREQISALEDFRRDNIDVVFAGTAVADLPMTLVLSDDLGQLAMENLSGFINPMPIGTMELDFTDLGGSLRTATDQTLHVEVATPTYDANTLTLTYDGNSINLTVAARNSTVSTDIVSDAEIKSALSEAVAVLIKGATSTWGTTDYASMVGVTGNRASGFDLTLTGELATTYASAAKTLSIVVTDGAGVLRGSYSTPTKPSPTSNTFTSSGPSLSNGVNKTQSIQLSTVNGATVVSSASITVAQSDASSGLVSDSQIQRALADSALQLITGSAPITQTISGIKVSATGETVYLSYRDAKQNITFTASTGNDTTALKEAFSRLLTGGTSATSLITVTGTRADGFTVTLSGSLASQCAGEIRVKTNDGIVVRYALVTVTGSRANGFDVVLSNSVAAALGSNTLRATVKETTASLTDTATGTSSVSGINLTTAAQTLVFSYAGKDSQRIAIGASADAAGVVSDAAIKSAIQSAVSTLLTGSASYASLVTVTGDRASGFAIALTGALQTGYTGTLTAQVVTQTVGATQGTYNRGAPAALSTQVKEAYQPAIAGSVNTGTGDGTPEGVPQDVDNEGDLSTVNTDPYSTSTGGSGATSASNGSSTPVNATSSTAPASQPSAAGQVISYILPNLGHWQDTMLDVLQKAGGLSADPNDLESFPLIFLLRDPTVLLDSLDSIFAGLQTALENVVKGIGKLPIIGDQLVDMTGAGGALDFVIDLRSNVLGSLKSALESTIDVYGGLDNAMRMWLFDVLTTDTNGDWIIDDADKANAGYNQWLNFVQDYNGDGIASADDIVVEYLIGENQDMSQVQLPPGLNLTAFEAGQRAFWVTSGTNVQIGSLSAVTGANTDATHTATLTVQPVDFGGYSLGFTLGSGDDAQVFQTAQISPDATAEDIQDALQTVLDAINVAYRQVYPTDSVVLATTVSVTDGDDAGTFNIEITGGELAGSLSLTASHYTTDAGQLVLDASMESIIDSTQAQVGDPIATLSGSTLTIDQAAEAGEYQLGFSYTVDGKDTLFETVSISHTASAWGIQKALQSALDEAREAFADDRGVALSTVADTVTVTGGAGGVFSISFSGGTQPGSLTLTHTDYTEFDRQAFLESVLEQTTGVQFRMSLGLSYSVDIPTMNFDVGVDGLPLYFTASGGLGIDINWSTYLGFGVDLQDGFFLNVNMPDHAGLGAVTVLDEHGHAVGVQDNEEDDVFSYMFAVGKKDVDLLLQGMTGAFFEHPDKINYYDGVMTDEVVFSVDVYLKGFDRDGDGEEDTPFSAEGQLLFLNANLHDDWSGYVQDNTGAYWGDISKSAESLWVKAERVLRTSAEYASATLKTEDPTEDDNGDALYGFILPDDAITQNGHVIDDPLYDLDYKALNDSYKSDHSGNDLFYIDSSGYLRYAKPYTVGNEASSDNQKFAVGDHVQQRKPNGRPLPNSVIPLGEDMFGGETGITGSRTHLSFEAALDIADPGAAGEMFGFSGGSASMVEGTVANGRLTFAKLAGASLADMIEVKAQVRAQINLVAELGIGLDGSGYLPSIHGGFHLYWGWETSSKEGEDPPDQFEMFDPQYDKLFPTEAGENSSVAKPSIWLTDISLDLGTWASNFMVPVAKKIQQVIAPVQPVIDALTATIPGLDKIMGRPYSLLDLASDLSKTFGGDARVEFVIAVVRLVETISKIPTDAANLIIPVTDVLVLSGVQNRQFNLSPVKGVISSINSSSGSAGIPGQTTVTLSQGMQNLGATLKKPGNALNFPIFSDPFQTTLNLLLGQPADLVTFTPPNLQVSVGFRMSFPVFPPLYVGLGGEIKVQANLTLGFDTFGITESLKTGDWTNVLNGFYVSDNIVNGVDVPEIILTTKIYVFAELNGGIIRGGVEGGIKFVGTLDLCDPNKDGKVRAFEIAAAVQDNPLDLVSANLRFSATVSAYLDVFAIFSYVRVFEYTFMDVTLFEWSFNPCDKKPVLATMDGSTLVLNTGSTVGAIDGNPAITYQASDRLRRDTTDGDEKYTLTGSSSSIHISAILPNGQTYTQDFSSVTTVRGYAGNGNDVLDASALDIPVYFVAGSGTDTLIGGSGNDVLVGSTTGTATLRGNGGNDKLIARGGTTVMAGAGGNDTYRFLGNWGQATLIDGSSTDQLGENTLDFSAQTQSVRIDDAYSTAIQGTNKVVWSASTSTDLIKGGSGSDILDFSGRENNLTMSVTGSDAGWVTGSSTGDSTVSGFSKSAAQTSIGSRGFSFLGFENAVGSQGSDVFYIRDGASLTGSLYGDTSVGLHHDDTTGNENANARNTIDFSDYTNSVTVNEEGASAFGTAGAKNITVRGMHNIFGGAAGDTLIGDGRNNLIVGNGGADTLEGRAMHDLLIADTFVTWTNENAAPSNPGVVDNYVRLEAIGMAAGFGGDGRRWIWMGQTLENRSLSTGSQVLKGGSGNDIEMGALGSDVFNVGGAGEGNDTIMADLGRIVVDYQTRSALYAYTKGAAGGNDTIYLGSGNNLVLAGSGNDTVNGLDKSDSMNIILADNGEVKFRYSAQTIDGAAGKRAFDTSPDLTPANNHMLEYVQTTLNENGAQGGKDSINLVSGSAVVMGGAGDDQITFSAVASTGSNVRWVAGDHARLDTDENGSVISFKTTDVAASTGGADTIRIGQTNDSNLRYLGTNYVLGGMGADTILVSAAYDAATATATFGSANSTDIILGDNGSITRPAGSQYLSQVTSTQIDGTLGGADVIATANGDKTIIGGQGADSITVNTADNFTTTTGNYTRLIAGDNAQIDYDARGQFIVFQTLDTMASTGGADVIRVGNDLSTAGLGFNVIFGGMAADQIYVAASRDESAQIDRLGQSISEDIILGDNGRIERSASTATTPNQLLQIVSTQTDKGGNDRILTANGGKVLVGGFGADVIRALDGDNLVMGDSAQIDYDTVASNGVIRSAQSIDIVIGGDDVITLAEGFKLVSGGYGVDAITINADNVASAGSTVTSSDAVGAAVWGAAALTRVTSVVGVAAATDAAAAAQSGKRGRTGRFVAGDNVRFVFDDQSGLIEMSDTDPIAATGGADAILLGADSVTTATDLGLQVVMGGIAGDTITVRDITKSEDILVGDNATFLREARNYAPISLTSTITETGGADVINTGRGDKIIVGGFGADIINARTVAASGTVNRSVVLGDSGKLSWTSGALQRVESTAWGFGGDDRVTVADGDVTFIGGYGRDTLSVDSSQSAFRLAAGDNALFQYNGTTDVSLQAESLSSAQTLDQVSSTGDGDELRIGAAGGLTGSMGQAIVLGGVGADTLTVTGQQADSLLIGDNGQIDVAQGSPASGAQLAMSWSNGQATNGTSFIDSVVTLLPELGAGDIINTVSGRHVLVGGQGADTLSAGRGDGVVFGDGARLSYAAGVLRQATSVGLGQGGNDTINLGSGSTADDGHRIVVGGVGADQITISSVQGTDTSAPRERLVSGDNATVALDASGRMTAFQTLDADAATGGADTVIVSVAGSGSVSGNSTVTAGLTDLNVVAGGVSDDTLTVSSAGRYIGVASGDNLDYRRNAGVAMYAGVLQPYVGGDDIIKLGSGELTVFGGAGADRIEATSVAGDRVIGFGDTGTVNYEDNGSGLLSQINTTADEAGGADVLNVGSGRIYLMGGAGRDTLIASGVDNDTRVVLGDTGQVNFSAGEPGLIQTSLDNADAANSADSIMVPSGTAGRNFVIGGAGVDTLISTVGSQDRVLPGSGMLDAATGKIVSVTVLGATGEFGYRIGTDGGPVDSALYPGALYGKVDLIELVAREGVIDTGDGTYTLTGEGNVRDGVTQSASGRIAYPSLTIGLATFPEGVINGAYGSLTMSRDGSWVYTVAGASLASALDAQIQHLQALATGEVRQEVFYVTTDDGSTTTVSITVQGNPLKVYAHNGAATEAGGVANAVAGSNAQGSAAAGGMLDNAVGSTNSGAAIARVSLVSSTSVSSSGAAGASVLGRYGALTVNADGSYVYVVDNSLAGVENLAAGEVADDTFDIQVVRDGGRTVVTQLTVRITGANDTPVVSVVDVVGAVTEDAAATGTLTDSGTIDFTDVDLSDVHSIGPVTSSSGALGTLSAIVSTDASDVDGTGGVVTWTYTVDNAKVKYLAAGETRVETFTFNVLDGHGGSVARTVTVTITGTNDEPVVASTDVTGGVTELVTPAGNLSDSGSIAFEDVDLRDTHSVVVTPEAGVIGTLVASVSAQASDVDGKGGVISWTYTVAADQVEYLAAGETRIETFTVTLSDGQGGSIDRTVTVTITGTADAPVVAVSDVTGGVLEMTAPSGQLTDSGTIAFTDVDLTNGHSVTVTSTSTSPLGTLTPVVTTDTTGSGTGGLLTWTYAVDADKLEYLAKDETRTETFTVTLTDSDGTTVYRTITVTLTGTNDEPVAVAQTGNAVEDETLTVTTGGLLTGAQDVDVADVLHVVGVASGTSTAPVAGTLTATGVYGTLVVNGDGSYTYDVNTEAGQGLAQGETGTEVFSYLVSDGQGGFTTQTLTLTVEGRNDASTVVGSTTAAVQGDVVTPVSGKLTVVDPDGNESLFNAGTVNGLYGSLTVDTAGNWTYVFNPALIPAGQTADDVLRLSTVDGTVLVMTVTVTGAHPIVVGGVTGELLILADNGVSQSGGTTGGSAGAAPVMPQGTAGEEASGMADQIGALGAFGGSTLIESSGNAITALNPSGFGGAGVSLITAFRIEVEGQGERLGLTMPQEMFLSETAQGAHRTEGDLRFMPQIRSVILSFQINGNVQPGRSSIALVPEFASQFDANVPESRPAQTQPIDSTGPSSSNEGQPAAPQARAEDKDFDLAWIGALGVGVSTQRIQWDAPIADNGSSKRRRGRTTCVL
ncbi:MAG: VCBS domain-containing protein [Aquabacterium sp.]|uniref:VCBS domain-containing protein n=1 Tax=Aquabacterium sp. TaxID=1872578 RepID=UPI003BC1EDE3